MGNSSAPSRKGKRQFDRAAHPTGPRGLSSPVVAIGCGVGWRSAGDVVFLLDLLSGHEPAERPLTRPSGTLSRRTGEGRGEGRFMGRSTPGEAPSLASGSSALRTQREPLSFVRSHEPTRTPMKHTALIHLGVLCCALTLGAQETPPIRLNTLGYLPASPKRASIAAPSTAFSIVRAQGSDTVYEGTVSGPATNPDTQEDLYTADFSAFTQPGEYRLSVAGVGQSAPFRIAPDVYRDAFRTVTRAMYLWRCGTAVRSEHNGRVFAHGACHTNDAWLDVVTGQHERKDGTRGWHDAGDYNKYVVNAGVTVGAMFRAWEDFGPAIRRVALDLPESGGPLPEFLAEVKWETDWLLTMQADDGSVYHKLSTKNFGGFILPDRETTERYFTAASSAATADFVAMLAQAARHFRPYDVAYADRCLAAAKKSHAWLTAHPENQRADLTGFRTGGYGTRDDDDRLWAAAELWETTGEAAALRELESRFRTNQAKVDRDFDWGSVGNLGVFTYLASRREGRDESLVAQLRENLLAAADEIVKTRDEHGYDRPLGNRYYWGCNGGVARQTLTLQAAWRVSPKPAYREAAQDALHHLFGRNLHGRSYVTGLGSRPPLHPHDRRSGGDEVDEPWPGYLVGGPHPKPADWKDEQEDYRTNEIAINWNAALIYALAAFLEGPEPAVETSPPVAAKKPDVIFVPTPQKVVDRMLELAEIKPGRRPVRPGLRRRPHRGDGGQALWHPGDRLRH